MGNKPSRQKELLKKKETIFHSQKKKVYRIPALFYNRDENILMAFAEKRKTEKDSHTKALVMKKGKVTKDENHEVTVEWSEEETVIKKHRLGYCPGYRPMNPCPLYEKTTKTLFLFFILVKGEEQWQIDHNTNKARLCYVKTTDAGQSWSDVTDLTDSFHEIKTWATFAVGPGHGFQTESGRLIVPVYAYVYSSGTKALGKHSTSHAISLYSDDKGKTWQFGKMFANENDLLECQMAEFIDVGGESVIYCNARTKGCYREEYVSHNGGVDFSMLSGVRNLVETGAKGCQGSVVSIPDQDDIGGEDSRQNQNKWLLFTHPIDTSERSTLGVYVNKSPQNPTAWSIPWIINCGPSGYSDLAYIGEGFFACLMECGLKKDNEQIAFEIYSYSGFKHAKTCLFG
ncbi:sialidase-3-like [Eleginops maclovinus]|uniref:sialidase-3-like n=1 Tax=Eleginops maclovinus TaxID=56733 RepID=UPI003080E25B